VTALARRDDTTPARQQITSLAPGLINRRFTEVGRLRLGDKTEKGAPRKLTKFRATSAARDLLERVAEVYGGTVEAWDGAPTGKGTQHQLYVEAETLDVLVPPGQVLTQAYEFWSGGGCQRRCNGAVQQDGTECVCPVFDPDAMSAGRTSRPPTTCALTTRLSVWLPKVPGIGVWRLESHGWYAANELPGAAEMLSLASEAGRPLPAVLRIASRVVKRDGKTNQFIVPQLEPAVTVSSLMALGRGEITDEIAALGGAQAPIAAPAVAAIGPSAEPPAAAKLAAAAAHPVLGRVLALGDEQRAHAKTIAGWHGQKLTVTALDNVPEFREALVEWLDVGAPLPADTPPAAPAEPVSGVVVDAETVEPIDLSDDGRPF
jgi:hypothetical protein